MGWTFGVHFIRTEWRNNWRIFSQQTKADRCEFGTNKDGRLLEQIIKGLKCSDERRNLISKPNLTLEIAIENIRAYKATTKNNTRYKDASEMKAGVYHEIEMRRTKLCTRCRRNHGKKRRLLCLQQRM